MICICTYDTNIEFVIKIRGGKDKRRNRSFIPSLKEKRKLDGAKPNKRAFAHKETGKIKKQHRQNQKSFSPIKKEEKITKNNICFL
jgi:hypothetical protein